MRLEFPKGFYWGSATSAHQVEGNNHNDWSEWEKSEARIKDLEEKGLIKKYGLENYISGWACDHYNRFREDFDIAKEINNNAHRFSIEWSRIEPEQGKFDEKEIEYYRQVISALRERGIEPFVTLWHWTLPLWIRDIGGWENKKTINYFLRYVAYLMRSPGIGDSVKFWITLNEPEIYASNSYLKGIWPPQKKNIFSVKIALNNLIRAHKFAYNTIHQKLPEAKIGIAKNNIYFEGWPFSFFTDWIWNKYFLNKIKKHQDFIGLNYYFHRRIWGNKNKEVSDMGQEIFPEGIYRVLKDLKKYNKPIYVTENGLADARDEKREEFIKEHLKWVHKAISEGVDVRGYFHWSLLDNFEWDKGFWSRFGLVEMNYETMERKIRPSAFEYAKICKTNALDAPDINEKDN